MEYIVAAFRSRSETVGFYDFLRSNGVNAEIINTPKEVGVGCGLSVKIRPDSLSLIKRAVIAFNAKTFAGVFLVKSVGGVRFIRSV